MNKYKKIADALLVIGIAVIVIGGIAALMVGGNGIPDPERLPYSAYTTTVYNTEGMQAILIPSLLSGSAALFVQLLLKGARRYPGCPEPANGCSEPIF